MMEEFHVAYLAYYPWQEPDECPDKLVSCRFLAAGVEEARQMAKAKIPQVLAAYTDAGDEVSEANILVEVRPWAAWGQQLDKSWETICNTTVEEYDD